MVEHPEIVGTFPRRCQMCNGEPRWELVRQGDVIVTWACESHMVLVLEDLLPTAEHRHQAMVTDLANAPAPRPVASRRPPMADAVAIYVAGPMTGLPGYNLEAFADAASDLARAGFDARNPGHRGVVEGHTWQDYMRDGLRMLLGCDAVAVLPGWDQSRGATLEVQVASALDMPVKTVADWLTEGAR